MTFIFHAFSVALCKDDPNGNVPLGKSCNRYWNCQGGYPRLQRSPAMLVFDKRSLRCVVPPTEDCDIPSTTPPPPEEEEEQQKPASAPRPSQSRQQNQSVRPQQQQQQQRAQQQQQQQQQRAQVAQQQQKDQKAQQQQNDQQAQQLQTQYTNDFGGARQVFTQNLEGQASRAQSQQQQRQ